MTCAPTTILGVFFCTFSSLWGFPSSLGPGCSPAVIKLCLGSESESLRSTGSTTSSWVTKLPELSSSQFLRLQNGNNNITGFVRIKGLAQNPHIVIPQLTFSSFSMYTTPCTFSPQSTLCQCTASPQTSHSYENDKRQNLNVGKLLFFSQFVSPGSCRDSQYSVLVDCLRLSSQNSSLSLEHVLFTFEYTLTTLYRVPPLPEGDFCNLAEL